MLHDESFAIGLAVGKKMGGGGDGVTMSDRLAGLGTLVDIWTIPRYDDPAIENPTRTQRATWDLYRIRYCCDILDDIYGKGATASVETYSDPSYSLEWTFAGKTADLMIRDAAHDTKWHLSDSYLIVSASAILIVYKDGTYDFPIILGGFVQDVQLKSTANRYDRYAFVEVSSADVFPAWDNLRTPAQVIDKVSRLTRLETSIPNYHYTHDSLGEGHLSKYFHRLDGYSSDAPPYPMEGPYTASKADVLPSFAALGTIRTGRYMYVGGYSETWEDENGEDGWHTISYWMQTVRTSETSEAPGSPHWCGVYPSKLCTYPHNKDDTDTSPGSYGDGLEDGYQDGYEAGEEAGQASGYQSGYNDGHTAGYTEGETAGHEEGYDEGHTAGYNEGYAAGETAGESAGYEEGYQAGYTAGQTAGYQSGYAAGESAGHDAGYSEGYEAGEDAGHTAGYQEGYAAGETAGAATGYDEGYAAGYAAGQAAGYQEGYEAGYQAGKQGETPQPSTDGRTHIEVNVGPIDRTLELLIAVTGPKDSGSDFAIPVGHVYVDWGDGSAVSDTQLDVEETDDLTLTHTYAAAGDYDIQIYANGQATMVLGHGGSATGLLGPADSRQAIKATAITIGDGVTGIDAYGLSGMWGCKSIYIPDGVTLGDYAMRQCYSLEAVRLPSDLLEIPSRCFYGCSTLQSVVIPETVTVIGNSAFYDCAGLKSIDIPDGVIDIGSSAFYGCTSLRSFVFPAGVTELPSSCFRLCYALNALTLSPNTTNIGGYAIYGIDALGSLEIPATVTRMSDYAVHSANGLRWLRMRPTTPPTTSQYTFSSFSSRCKIIVPDGSGEAYKTATRWKNYASRIYEESEVAW